MFTKKNMMVLGIMLIVVSGLLADDVDFEKEPDASAANIQGKVYFWDYDIEDWVPAGPGHTVYMNLYNSNGTIFDEGSDDTNGFSFYENDFNDSGGNSNYCNEVEVIFRGNHYYEAYDGCVRIDIYYKDTIYDPTIPGGE